MNQSASIPRPFALLSLAMGVAGVVVFVFTWLAHPPVLSIEFALLLISALVSENFAVEMTGYSFSIAYPLTMATMVLCGPSQALIVAALTSVSIVDRQKPDWPVILFNLGQLLLCASLAAWTYLRFGGRVLLESGGPWGGEDFPRMMLPLILTAVVGATGNVAFASAGVSVKHGLPLSDVVESVGWLPAGQVAFGAVGFIIAQVMAIDPAAFAFFIFPLLVARQFYERFSALKSAYADTIRSLVGALEAKDPYTRGHSERVAEYAVLIAQAAGLDSKSVSELEYAALLHDLGKIALPGDLLRKPGKLNEEEWEAIRGHPGVGAAMVRRIPPLRKHADTVNRHHERLNGSGYPDGLHESDLSTAARILAIADSFDAMTSSRPYRAGLSREAAISELRRCSPEELDTDLVEVFVQAIWQKNLPVLAPSVESMASAEGERVM